MKFVELASQLKIFRAELLKSMKNWWSWVIFGDFPEILHLLYMLTDLIETWYIFYMVSFESQSRTTSSYFVFSSFFKKTEMAHSII